jgi:hypothetical protein
MANTKGIDATLAIDFMMPAAKNQFLATQDMTTRS